MRVDEGHASLASPLGSIISILLALILLAYTFLKVDSFINKKGVDIKVTDKANYYDASIEFSADQGFNVAFQLRKFSWPFPDASHYSFRAYINDISL